MLTDKNNIYSQADIQKCILRLQMAAKSSGAAEAGESLASDGKQRQSRFVNAEMRILLAKP